MDGIDKLLHKISTQWSTSDCKEAMKVAAIIQTVLEKNQVRRRPTVEWTSPPDLSKLSENPHTDGTEDILCLLRDAEEEVYWVDPSHVHKTKSSCSVTSGIQEMHHKLKYGVLVGLENNSSKYLSDNLVLGFTYLPPGTKYPLHAHHAAEVFQVLVGAASWGPTATYLTKHHPGDFIYHAPAVPHTMHVPENEPLLTVFAWTGNVGGKFWFVDIECGEKFSENIRVVSDPTELYNKMAENYEEVVRGWGYNMPEIVAEKIKELTEHPTEMKILDLGCGDGLVGEALKARGFVDITGMDISVKMLAIAAKKQVYDSVHEVDLLKTLPAHSEVYDILSCVGTSTYLETHVFDEWLRVVKKGGWLVFTHKTGVMKPWEDEQDRRESNGKRFTGVLLCTTSLL